MRSARSKTVTEWPALLSWAAAASPAGPLPTTATRLPVRCAGGWAVTHTTLANERAVIGVGAGGRNADDVIALARRCGVTDDPRFRQELAQMYVRTATLRYLGLRLRTAMSQGRPPGPEASVLKLASFAVSASSRSVT